MDYMDQHKNQFVNNPAQPHLLLLSLPFAIQLPVWGIRLLSKGYSCDIEVTSVLIDGFKRTNAIKAAGSLDFLMTVIFRGLNRSFAINCPCSPILGEDEAKLVSIIGNAQCSNYPGISKDLSEFLLDDAVENASYLMFEYADALTSAGLFIPENDIIEKNSETRTSENLKATTTQTSEMIN